MKCIVTGACGFVGTNLCEKLLSEGNEVLAIDNFSVGDPEKFKSVLNKFSKYKLIEGDISEGILYNLVYKDVDVIYHLAGMSGVRESVLYPDVWFKNNVIGTFNVLEAARKRGIQNVVMASSSASVGDVDPPVTEDIHMKPISPYGASKGFMELYTTAYFHSYGMNVSSLRFSNVYGPYSTLKISLVAKFIKKILNNEQINIYGSGEQTRDFIYVKDLINAIVMAGNANVGGEIFQICTGLEMSVNSMTEFICDIMKKNGYHIPSINYTEPAVGDIMTNYASNEKVKRLLNWSPKVSISQGIEDTVKWFIGEEK